MNLDIQCNPMRGAAERTYVPRAFNSAFYLLEYDEGFERDPIGYFHGVQLKGLDVYRFECGGVLRSRRRWEHFQVDHVDDFILVLPLSSPITLAQGSRILHIEPGSVAFHSTAKPYEAICNVDPVHSGLFVKIAGSMLRPRVPHIDRCCDRSIEIRPGAGRIMHTLLDVVLAEGRSLSEVQERQFSAIVIDSIAGAVAEAPELLACASSAVKGSSLDRVRQAAIDFIDCRLSDPALNAAEIARQCRVSLRYLHAAFAAAGVTVGTFIRDARLERCRQALRNASMENQSIIEIAMRWGFNDPSHFGRIYKAKFGAAPSADRASLDELERTPHVISC